MTRYIGIIHGVKKKKSGEKSPTTVTILLEDDSANDDNAIVVGPKFIEFDLETEQDELDFILGRFPISNRNVKPDEDISDVPNWQVNWKKAKDDTEAEGRHASQVRVLKKTTYVAKSIPAEYEGLQQGDEIAMPLGGSGDRLACAIVRHGETIGATLFRIPTFRLKDLGNELL